MVVDVTQKLYDVLFIIDAPLFFSLDEYVKVIHFVNENLWFHSVLCKRGKIDLRTDTIQS